MRILSTDIEIPLEGRQQITVGRCPTNDVVIDDWFVSQKHCTLWRGDGCLIVRDQSRNGTNVNGAWISEGAVRVGARITIGKTTLLVTGGGSGPRMAAVELVGSDRLFLEAVRLALRTAPSNANVLVLGESGTGKELIARLVHEASHRNEGPFVPINCASIPSSLVESELFGHERGAFTGAVEQRQGVFEQAHRGTLFLDEIGELPRDQQPRLLRVLETRRIRRVGGIGEVHVDVRIISATHRGLREASHTGGFRLDLLHRLATVEVEMPALRQRPGDIPVLARKLIADLEPEVGRRTMSEATLEALKTHAWPGNVRELRNAIYRAALLHPEEELTAEAILATVHHVPVTPPTAERAAEPSATYETFDQARAQLVVRSLGEHGSIRRAADAIGMKRSTFHDYVRRMGIKKPER